MIYFINYSFLIIMTNKKSPKKNLFTEAVTVGFVSLCIDNWRFIFSILTLFYVVLTSIKYIKQKADHTALSTVLPLPPHPDINKLKNLPNNRHPIMLCSNKIAELAHVEAVACFDPKIPQPLRRLY